MSIRKKYTPELIRDEYTEYIYTNTISGDPIDPEDADDIINGIKTAIELNDRPVFLEGVSARLTELGISCTANDKELILAEIKRRYKEILGFSCPRAVKEWCRGTTPGVHNRRNHYELCYALEMDYNQTAVFFQKHYLTLPFNVKSRVDAVFMYALYHKKPYSTVTELLNKSDCFVSHENAHALSSTIFSMILNIDDDEKFLTYLSEHCYNNKQQFQTARAEINKELETIHKIILNTHIRLTDDDPKIYTNRLGSLTIERLLGQKYQSSDKKIKNNKLPKRFAESLPNDVTLGKIINGDAATHDLLRKTLMLLKFYNIYSFADNSDPKTIRKNLMDFYAELNSVLISCGFAQLYVRHPFDCLLLYCANSYEPIDTLYCVIENGRN